MTRDELRERLVGRSIVGVTMFGEGLGIAPATQDEDLAIWGLTLDDGTEVRFEPVEEYDLLIVQVRVDKLDRRESCSGTNQIVWRDPNR